MNAEEFTRIFFGLQDRGRTAIWGEDLPPDVVEALKQGEIITMLKDSRPFKTLTQDRYGQLWEKPIGGEKAMTTYENNQVPDADFETCLRVIRTVRNACLGPKFFDGEGAVILSHAHAKLTDLAKMCGYPPEEKCETSA